MFNLTPTIEIRITDPGSEAVEHWLNRSKEMGDDFMELTTAVAERVGFTLERAILSMKNDLVEKYFDEIALQAGVSDRVGPLSFHHETRRWYLWQNTVMVGRRVIHTHLYR